MKYNISLLAGLKNNLAYSKNFYYTTRALYPDVEIVFTSYNSTDGTNEWLDSLHDDNLVYYHSPDNKTFAETFNKCTQLATSKYVAFTHNDMVLTPGFVENIEKHAADDKVIYYTTIEPPIFSDDMRPGKIVKDFGSALESLDKQALYAFALQTQQEQKDMTNPEKQVTFFLCVSKKILTDTGGLDPLFNPMFCEDDDLILRLRLAGLVTVTSLDAICYHFVSKTSRFSDEYQHKTKQIEANSNKNFVRKWGFSNSSPIKKKYDTGFAVKNCDDDLLARLEPWCATIYVDCPIDGYIISEQANTKFNLNQRIKPLTAEKTNDILVSFNGKRLNKKAFKIIQHLNELIYKQLNDSLPFLFKLMGKNKLHFKTGIFTIQINRERTHENELINLNREA